MDKRSGDFIKSYIAGATFEEAAEEVGASDVEVSGWLVEDEDFARLFERAMDAKELRVRQMAIDSMQDVVRNMIELGKSTKAASVQAAKFLENIASKRTSSRPVEDAGEEFGDASGSDPEDYAGELEEIARGIKGKE